MNAQLIIVLYINKNFPRFKAGIEILKSIPYNVTTCIF